LRYRLGHSIFPWRFAKRSQLTHVRFRVGRIDAEALPARFIHGARSKEEGRSGRGGAVTIAFSLLRRCSRSFTENESSKVEGYEWHSLSVG